MITRRDDLPDLPFKRYRSRAKPVTAVQLTAPVRIPNPYASEGTFKGEVGAWKITHGPRPDGSVDVAICREDIFKELYEHKGGDLYQKRPAVVIEAVQLKRPLDVTTLEGPSHGEAGDWLLIGVSDEPYFASDDYFKTNYVSVG